MSGLLTQQFTLNGSQRAELSSFNITDNLKDKYYGLNSKNSKFVKMTIDDIKMSNIQDSFKIHYSRYLGFNGKDNTSNLSEITVEKKDKAKLENNKQATENFLFDKKLLGYFKLNFVHLSYGNAFEFNRSKIYDNETKIKKNFKFFIEYDTFTRYNNEVVTLYLSET